MSIQFATLLKAANRLTSAQRSSGSATYNATYAYDVFGDRVQQQVDADGAGAGAAVTGRFAYDGQEIWADLNGSSQVQTQYLRGNATDELFARSTNSSAGWYLTDRLGSVRDIANSSGTLVDHINYDGFGNVTSESSPTDGDRFKYTGREQDAVSGLQYNRARYLDGGTGRWISQDPLRHAAGDANLYRYVWNATTTFTDPSGLTGGVGGDDGGGGGGSSGAGLNWNWGQLWGGTARKNHNLIK